MRTPTEETPAVPGPRGLPGLGLLPWLLRDPFGTCMRAARDPAGLVRLRVGPVSVYLVYHPDFIQRVLVTEARRYGKGPIMRGIREALGDGLFTAENEPWVAQRRLMQPAFHRRRIDPLGALATEIAVEHMQGWDERVRAGDPVDGLQEMILLNIRFVVQALFGSSMRSDDATRIREATDGVFKGMASRIWTFFLPAVLPLPGRKAFTQAIATLDQEVQHVTRLRRAQDDPGDDLLGLLLCAQDEETGRGMTDREVRDEIFTLFQAGYESTASGLTWTLHLLARHPEIQAQVRRELQEVVGDRDATVDDFPRLPRLCRAIDEALRLYPPFPMFFRTTECDVELGPYHLPKGAPLILSPYATHHHPDFWDDPERFDPDRFAPERMDDRTRRAYYPFGAGQRLCIGRGMALMESRLILAAMLRRYEWAPASDRELKLSYALTLQPRGGLPLRLRALAKP